MTDLVEFLRARITEDEEAAKEGPAPGTIYVGHPWWQLSIFDGGESFCVAIDPARVLAECEAKRVIIDMHDGDHECPSAEDNCGWWMPGMPSVDLDGNDTVGSDCPTMHLLARSYADHPDCREKWRS